MLELTALMTLLMGLYIYFLAKRYKRCPADKVLVVSGKTASGKSAEIYKGGAAFVWPVIQEYAYLSLQPFTTEISVRDAINEDNQKTSLTVRIVAGIGEKDTLLEKAASRLLSLKPHQLTTLTEDIAMGQIRQLVRGMTEEEIYTHQNKLIEALYPSIGNELNKVGLQLINVDLVETIASRAKEHPTRLRNLSTT